MTVRRALLCIGLGLVFALIAHCALANDDGQWDGVDPVIRQWYQSLMQPDNPNISCCGEADAFGADSYEAEGDHYLAIITNGKGLIANGTRISVPNKKIKWDKGNPTGHGIIFLSIYGGNAVLCYVPPGGV